MSVRRVCVFCGSSTGNDERITTAASNLAEVLVRRGIEVVYGGGHVGIMGIVADTALGAGGTVIGVIPRGLFSREIAHTDVTVLHEVASMHERKTMMYDLSDAFVALPGGFGTLEELAEITTWAQLGMHDKPIALFDVAGFWEGLITQFDRMLADGLLKPENRRLMQRHDDADEMLDAFNAYVPTRVEKWIDAEER